MLLIQSVLILFLFNSWNLAVKSSVSGSAQSGEQIDSEDSLLQSEKLKEESKYNRRNHTHKLVIVSGGDDQSITICQFNLKLMYEDNLIFNSDKARSHPRYFEYRQSLDYLHKFEGASGSAIKDLKPFLIQNKDTYMPDSKLLIAV